MNTTNQQYVSFETLEKQLQQKLNEYTSAEGDGKHRDELNAIYKEIKNIRYQLTMLQYQPQMVTTNRAQAYQ